MPKVSLAAPSALLRVSLLATGPFITALPSSVLRLNAGRHALKMLPLDLQIRGYPVAILTLKNRVLSPLVGLFIEHVRQVAEIDVRVPVSLKSPASAVPISTPRSRAGGAGNLAIGNSVRETPLQASSQMRATMRRISGLHTITGQNARPTSDF